MQQEEVMLSSDTISRQLGFVCMFLALLHVLSSQVTQPILNMCEPSGQHPAVQSQLPACAIAQVEEKCPIFLASAHHPSHKIP